MLKQILMESINNFSLYKNYFQEIFLILKENKKYEKTILKYYNPESEEKYFKIIFLLFFQSHIWINPNDINIYAFPGHFKLKHNEIDDKAEQTIIMNFESDKIMKIFVYWYIYLLVKLTKVFEEKNNTINNNMTLNEFLYEIKNILMQTNNKIINIYKTKKINIEDLYSFLYIYLFFIEDNTKNILFEKQLKILNKILFILLFDLFQKISIITVSQKDINDQNKNNINLFYSFLSELKENVLINNDYNIIILLENNIIKNFIENILMNINPKIFITKSDIPSLVIRNEISGKLADFYSTFVKFRFNKAKVMDFLINNVKNGLINLRYFKEEKEQILSDVFIQNFQSDLIKRILLQESNKRNVHPNFDTFLFNGNNSKMSFKLGKFDLNDNMIIFSFKIKPNINRNNSYNDRQTLISLYNYSNDQIFKLILKKDECVTNKPNKESNINKIDNKKEKFILSISYNNKEEIELYDLDKIETNLIYFICIHFNTNNPYLHTYLCSSGNSSKILKSYGEIKMNKKEDDIILNIGYDLMGKEKEYFSGYIGNLYIIKLYNIKNKIDYDNNKIIIESILQLKEFYRYFIYYFNNNTEFNLDYMNNFKNKKEIYIFKEFQNIRSKAKNLYETILFLSPEIFKFLNINEKDNINNYRLPFFSGICEKQKLYSFNEINISIVKYENSREVFLRKNGFDYFCLQFEYFFQLANYYILFMNQQQEKQNLEQEKEKNDKESKEIKTNEIIVKKTKEIKNETKEEIEINIDTVMQFYQENIELIIDLIKSSINNSLLLLTQYIADLNIMNFTINLKKIFATLLSSMKSLNNIRNIISSTFHPLNSIIILICEQIQERYFRIKNKATSDYTIKFLTSFRDGLIVDILLFNEFYITHTKVLNTQYLGMLFDKMISIIESNDMVDITISYSKIFLKVLSFTSTISDLFLKYDENLDKNNLRNSRGGNSILYNYLKLIRGLIIRKRNNSNEDIFFKQLIEFSLLDYRHNQFISYAFLNIINDLLKDGFSLDEKEILNLINYLKEIVNNKEHNLDLVNDNEEVKNSQTIPEKITNNLSSLIISILLDAILKKNKKKYFNNFCTEIKQAELNDQMFMSIINNLYQIITENLSYETSPIKNTKSSNTNSKSKSTSNVPKIDEIDFRSFYEDLFDFILILFKKKFEKNENESKNNEIENIEKENIINKDIRNKPDEVKLNLINLVVFIEEMINGYINNKSTFQIGVLYCLLNLIKLFHIITFDEKLMNIYLEEKFLVLFKIILDLLIKSKILFTNFFINPYEKPSSVSKTIPETILDICIKLVTSDEIKDEKNDNLKREIILTKDNIIEFLKEAYLLEKIYKKNKIEENKKRTLFCFNDIFRKIFSGKISNAENEIIKFNKNKNIIKYFPKLDKDFVNLFYINDLLVNREKKFNYNFITFNLEKIYKYKFNLESSNQNLKDFFDTLLSRLINEHQILYNFDKDFFFKSTSNYTNYNIVKTKIESILSKKAFDESSISKFLEDHFSVKGEVSELITSDLCENIKEKRKRKKSETSKTSKISFGSKFERQKSINSLTETKTEYLNISPGTLKTVPNSVNLYDKIINNNINNSHSRTNSISSLDLESSSQNEEISSQSEDSSNLNSAENTFSNVNKILLSKSVSSRDTSNYSVTKSALPPHYQIDGTSSNSNNNYKSTQKKSLLEEVNENCYFNILDSMYVINAKNEFMKNIFSIYFLDTFFYDKTFIELKRLYNQIFEDKLKLEMNKNININYPSKIKNFSNGIEPPLFIKPFNNFFDYKTTPISHKFFFDFIKEKNKKYKYQYINLFKKQVIIPEKEKTCQFTCELVKIDHSIYGTIILSNDSEYLFFEQENFENIYNQNINKVDYDGLFSLSCIKLKERENDNINKNNYQSRNSIPKNKMLLILVSEIEEIIERRFLLMWQGFEIYLKDGRSYFFNFFRQSKYDKFKKKLSKNSEFCRLFHKKDYLTKEKSITKAWIENILTTYEYLLFINKYASRTFNDTNQYYIFPWILSKFQNLIIINEKDNINEDKRKLSIISNNDKSKDNDKEIKDTKEDEISKSFRNFKYPISLQKEDNRKLAMYRYNDDDESKFHFHLGTHYSTAPFIYYYLMRQEPYNTLLIKLQNYQQENPNRMFIGILETSYVLKGGNDNRELIPEFFSKIEFFLNLNCSFFGLRTNDILVNNVHIGFMKNKCESQILISDYVRLIYEHKKLLNSNLIATKINTWIDNIFGIGQLPDLKVRKNCCNIFRKTTYEKVTNLIKKVDHYKEILNKKYDSKTIRYKIMNKINLIISFGQTPFQVFKEAHPIRTINTKNIKRGSYNLGYNNKYEVKEDNNDDDEKDVMEIFSDKILRPSFNQSKVQFGCIYFELNIINNKIFGLTPNEEVVEIDFNIKDGNDNISTLSLINNYKIPHIKFFEKIKLKQSNYDYYIYKPKYAFCSFKNEDEYNAPSRKGSFMSGGSNSNLINAKGSKYNFNTYYKNLLEDIIKVDYDGKNNEESFKFMQCRYLDNSFKLYKITKIKNAKKKEKEIIINSYSYICEDFVASCCPISSDQFVVGLENGKLIRWKIYDLQKNRIKLIFDKNIQAHRSRISAIETDKRLGLIITCGNDNFIQIRKLYNFELITPIQISQKYIVTMAKVSPINLLYVMCFDKTDKKSFILGYTLTGIKFAKSEGGYYGNIDFTRSGNIVSLLNNKEICILNAYDLKRKQIKKESGYSEFKKIEKKVEGSVWMEYKYLFKKKYNTDGTKINNIIVYMKHGKRPEDSMIFYYDFKGNNIFD